MCKYFNHKYAVSWHSSNDYYYEMYYFISQLYLHHRPDVACTPGVYHVLDSVGSSSQLPTRQFLTT